MTKKKYFAILDGYGNPVGFYPSDVWPTPPDGAIEITEEQYLTFLSDQGTVAHRLIGGQLVECNVAEQQAQYAAARPAPPMTVPMSYAAAITAGLIVTSASGIIPQTTVSLAMQQLSNLANVSIYAHIHGKFPGGQPSLPLVATDGTTVDVPSIAAWQEIATAAADFVALCDVAMRTGMDSKIWVAPSNVATIS